MPDVEGFLKNLRDVGLFLSTALKSVGEDKNAFLKAATPTQIASFEEHVAQIRALAGELDRELSYLEYLIPAQ